MTRAEVWAAYVKRNPRFPKEGAHFTADGLRKFFDQTWALAHKAAQASVPTNPFDAMFGKR